MVRLRHNGLEPRAGHAVHAGSLRANRAPSRRAVSRPLSTSPPSRVPCGSRRSTPETASAPGRKARGSGRTRGPGAVPESANRGGPGPPRGLVRAWVRGAETPRPQFRPGSPPLMGATLKRLRLRLHLGLPTAAPSTEAVEGGTQALQRPAHPPVASRPRNRHRLDNTPANCRVYHRASPHFISGPGASPPDPIVRRSALLCNACSTGIHQETPPR